MKSSQRARVAHMNEQVDIPATVIKVQGFKPKLRGIPDIVATVIALPAGAILIASATVSPTAAAAYGLGLVFLFGISATYHTPMWPKKLRRIFRKFDHSAIYVLMAVTYAPVCLAVLEPNIGHPLFGVVVVGSSLGIAKCFFWERSPRWLNTLLYLAMGWMIVPFVPELLAGMSLDTLGALSLGGVVYSLGAVVYTKRWPNPSPAHFGYHEVFHLFVIAAAAFHYYAVWQMLVV